MTQKDRFILNLAAGKMLEPLDDYDPKKDILYCVDLMYNEEESTSILQLEKIYQNVATHSGQLRYDTTKLCKMDVLKFLNNYKYKFDKVVSYRFFEHVARRDMLFFLYILSTVMKIGSELDIIVPNYNILANRILNENAGGVNWEAEDILTTTEVVNEPEMPHASIWTPRRANYYLELENRFIIKNIEPKFEFDGRDIYMRIKAERMDINEVRRDTKAD